MARPPLHNSHLYAVAQERLRHDDAAMWYGEMSCFVLWWSAEDHSLGLVGRCETCYLPYGRIAEVYNQAPKAKCSNCYGTTFEGGFRALLYRPALWDHTHLSEEIGQRGLTVMEEAIIQPTTDFQMRDNDLVIRGDNSRWRISIPKQTEIATGFGSMSGWDAVVTGNVSAKLEDPTSVVYTVPVNLSLLNNTAGWSPSVPYPSGYDIINGSLVLP